MLLSVEHLQTFYGESHVVQDVSFHVDRGELVCLLGRNGAGKTTILRSISGLTPPRAGAITFKGQSLTRLNPSEICRRGIGLVLEDRGIFNDMTVLENLEAARRRDGAERWSLERLYDLFPVLAERRRQRAGTLSGGEQQMLAIARALRNQPELLMLDEPSEGLARPIVRRLAEVMRTLKRDITMLLVDQNFSLIEEVGERGYIIEKGRVVDSVTIEAFRKDREVVERYLGVRRARRRVTERSPAMSSRAPITAETIRSAAAQLVGRPVTPAVAAEHAASFEPLMEMIAGLRGLPLKEVEPPVVYRPEEDPS